MEYQTDNNEVNNKQVGNKDIGNKDINSKSQDDIITLFQVRYSLIGMLNMLPSFYSHEPLCYDTEADATTYICFDTNEHQRFNSDFIVVRPGMFDKCLVETVIDGKTYDSTIINNTIIDELLNKTSTEVIPIDYNVINVFVKDMNLVSYIPTILDDKIQFIVRDKSAEI